jgi:ABC-type multidrug transport system permease subunit
MQPILSMLKKEFKQIFRTREMMAIIFGVPLAQMVILGYTITNEVKNISLLIADNDRSTISREIMQSFEHTDRFHIIGYEYDQQKIKDAIQNWQAQLVIVIPVNFGRDLIRNSKPELQLLVDGLDGNSAGIALGYAQGILYQWAETYLNSFSVKPSVLNAHQIVMQDRVWYNLNLDNAQYMIPGIVVVLVSVISMMLSGINLVREKELGTLEQLMVTPLKRYQLLLGKIVPFLILTFIEMAVVMTAAQFIFSVKVQGSYLLLALLAFLFLFSTLGLGIFVSTITSTQQQAMFVAWFFMVFMLMMGGFFIPIANMPPILQKITYLNPMRYFLSILRDIFQKGSTLRYLMIDIIPMTLYGFLIFTISVIKFHKRVA